MRSSERLPPADALRNRRASIQGCEARRLRSALVGSAILLMLAASAEAQSRAEYVGGTAAQLQSGASGLIDVRDEHYFAFYSKKGQVRVRYDKIDDLEYGQKVDRRLLMAVIISPMFLLSKRRKHFLSIGYVDEDGNHQALVFRVDKNDIRATLVSLEARTGLRIQYQDDEARQAGKG